MGASVSRGLSAAVISLPKADGPQRVDDPKKPFLGFCVSGVHQSSESWTFLKQAPG